MKLYCKPDPFQIVATHTDDQSASYIGCIELHTSVQPVFKTQPPMPAMPDPDDPDAPPPVMPEIVPPNTLAETQDAQFIQDTGITWVTDHWELPDLAVRQALIKQVYARARQAIDAATRDYAQSEQDDWRDLETEARAHKANPQAKGPLLTEQAASADPRTTDEYATVVIEKADAFRALKQAAVSRRSQLIADIASAIDPLAVDITVGW